MSDITCLMRCTHTHTHTHTYSYLTVIGVHEMHTLLVVDLFSSLDYLMMTHHLHIAGNLPIKTSVARQLPTNIHTHTHSHTQTPTQGNLQVEGMSPMI